MNHIVHQIWIGKPMEGDMVKWVDRIKEAATDAGWKYKLWNLEDILAEYPTEGVRKIAKALKAIPWNSVLATILSDYIRYAILSQHGGLYLDTDFYLNYPWWPTFPTDPGIYGMNEWWDRESYLPCNGIIWLPTEAGKKEMEEIWKAGEVIITDFFPQLYTSNYIEEVKKKINTDGFEAWNLCGPEFFRGFNLPIYIFPTYLASHIEWKLEDTQLIHMSAKSWIDNKV